VELEELKDNRLLVIIEKVRATPPRYPRRPGIPAKRPLEA
jgi:16S rRNA (guanine527-N7)-methyltransferase